MQGRERINPNVQRGGRNAATHGSSRSAHEAAACSLRKALSGRFAASLGNLVEYESCQLPLPLGPSFRLNTLLGDCSLILKAEEVAPLKSVPLARRAPRDELEATRAAIQVFLLIRHARNVLLRLPDDVRLKTRTLPADAPIDVPASAQLLPCRLHLPGRPAQGCRLLLYPAEATAPTVDVSDGGVAAAAGSGEAKMDGIAAARSLLVLLRPQPPPAPDGSASAVAHVVVSVPLTALAFSVAGGGTRLLCRVPRHHAPPGVSPDQPLQLEFDELWRCSAAKSQLEAACTAARAEQHRRLVAMLGAGRAAAPASASE